MCGNSSAFAKISLVLIFVALILQIVGLATPYWMQSETTNENVKYSVGLWNVRNCGGNESCSSTSIPENYKTTAFTATIAFEIITILLMFVAFVIICMYIFAEKFQTMSVAVFYIILCFVTVAVAIIGMVIWISDIPDKHYPSYSFGICVMAFVLVFLAGIILIPDIRMYSDRRRGQQTLKVAPASNQDFSYNRRYNSARPTKLDDSIRHYYNPNRDPYMGKSPPPAYRTHADSRGTGMRSEIMTPDVYLGRSHKRY